MKNDLVSAGKNELVSKGKKEVEAQTENCANNKGSDTDWRKAYLTLCHLIATDFISSHKVSNYVDNIRKTSGDEAADSLVKVFNSLRTQFMQDFMG
jgi:hypothetical protein